MKFKKLQGSAPSSYIDNSTTAEDTERASEIAISELSEAVSTSVEPQFPANAEKINTDNVGILAGRLKYFYNVWKKYFDNSMVLKWIQGYEITFKTPVYQTSLPTEKPWSLNEKMQISNQINQLLKKGAIEKCNFKKGQFLSSIFLIPKPDG